MTTGTKKWKAVCKVADVAENTGTCVVVDGRQIAIYNFARLGKWYATDNRCPHWGEQVLSRGLLANPDDVSDPYVACPMHKKRFSLETGACLAGDVGSIRTYDIVIDGDDVLLNIAAVAVAA